MTAHADYRKATFRAATTGLRAWRVAKALNSLTRGVDWRGCTKARLCEAYAQGEHGLVNCTGADLRRAIASVEAA